MRVVRWLFGLVLLLALAVAALLLVARFGDGPTGPLPGGPLRAGELVAGPQADWSFVADVKEVELQLEAQTTSRTTWVVVKDGAAFIPCSLDFPPFKSWYKKVAAAERRPTAWEGLRHRP